MSPEEARHEWAHRFTSRCTTPPPGYGSPAWLALEDADPRKVAAVVLAAEFAVLAVEAHKAAEDAAFVARREAHRAAWTGSGFRRDPVAEAEIQDEWAAWAGWSA